jgi:HPt (histidine-containing phosphotransfer) domain-containing protein
VIAWGRVNELRDEIGANDFDEVVALFLEEADAVILRISPVAGAKALECDLHFLKGAALNLGFSDFANFCQDGERRAAVGDLDVDLAQLCASYQASKRAFALGRSGAHAA